MDVLSLVINISSILGMAAIATIVTISSTNKSKPFFAATIYSLCLWLSLQYITQIGSPDGVVGLRLVQLASAVSFAIAVFFYGFIRSYLDKPITIKYYVLFTVFFILSLFLNMSGLMIEKVSGSSSGLAIDKVTTLYQIYTVALGIIIITAIAQLLVATWKFKSRKDKLGNRLLMTGFLQAVVAIVISNLFFGSSPESQLVFPLTLVVMSILVGLAIIKYRFFDIRLAVVRVVTYALSLLTLSGVYYSFAYAISSFVSNGSNNSAVDTSPVNIVLVLLLAFIFQPLKRFFDRITNRVFYKDNYNTDDFFARLNKTLSVTTDLRGLLERVSYEIATTLKAEQAFFFIFTTAEGNYVTAGTEHHKQLPKHDAVLFEQYYDGKEEVVAASLMKEDDPVRRMMVSHRIELVLPLILDGDVIGYLCLGDHKTSGYTNRDIKALNTVSDELIIAIQNALAVHEIRELNATLQQRIANATKELRSKNAILLQLDKIKDEFISMASHQLRTPLTSVKGYLSMVIEGDAGKISPSQKQLLDQAFMSSENMVHLINDFLNVSRIQSGKFIIDKTPVDLSRLVEEEVSGLRPNATARGMKLVYKKPAKFPLIEVDEGKMRQVVMNFSDNAIYYSHENSSIMINLGIEGKEIVFTVKDTGIGVPKKEQDKLFAKFYRADNAKIQRPDGTGVGIYLAKKVIDAHGGQIIFESVEGKGSTFGFRLPLKSIETTLPATTTN